MTTPASIFDHWIVQLLCMGAGVALLAVGVIFAVYHLLRLSGVAA